MVVLKSLIFEDAPRLDKLHAQKNILDFSQLCYCAVSFLTTKKNLISIIINYTSDMISSGFLITTPLLFISMINSVAARLLL